MGNTISENKAATSAVVATGLLGLTFWAYKKYKEEQPQDQPLPEVPQSAPSSKQKATNIQEQILKLKTQIDVNNPTLDDVKRLFTLLANHVRSKTLEVSDQFKNERRKRFPKDRRFTEIADYFRFTSEGLITLQKNIMELQGQQTKLLALVGINQAKFAQFAAQLGPFMQQLVFGNTDISLPQLKKSLEMKTEYLQDHGERVVEALIELSTSLSLQEKQHIPLFLNIILSDQAFQNEPQLDKEEFDMAYEKYKAQIAPELNKLESVIMPLMGKLQTALVGDQMGGMGGFGGYGAAPDMYQGGQGYGEYDQMGGMNEEVMMQQLQQLRLADPQAYEQIMMMMQAQAQMGR